MRRLLSSYSCHFDTLLFILQAMECCIAGVVPLADDWSAECRMTVRQLLVGKTVKVKLVETPESARIHAVDILLSQGGL